MRMTRARQAMFSSLLIAAVAAVSPVMPGAAAQQMPRTVTIYGIHDKPAAQATRMAPAAPPPGVVRTVTPVLRHKAPAAIQKAIRPTTATQTLHVVKEAK